MNKWPNKNEREKLEIAGFISAYRKLKHGRNLEIVSKQERPDYIVKDTVTGERFGIELTSVYSSSRSVPDEHKLSHDELVDIPHNPAEIELYKNRLIRAVEEKNIKAQGYDKRYPLILSVYVNEYCSIYISRKEWEKLIMDNEHLIDSSLFAEIVLWDLPDDGAFSVIPKPMQ